MSHGRDGHPRLAKGSIGDAIRNLVPGGGQNGLRPLTTAEVRQLWQPLQGARLSMYAGHMAAERIWREPLSLFDVQSELDAFTQGVAPWAIAVAQEGRDLVDMTAELCDAADVVETQLAAAKADGHHVLKEPIITLTDNIKRLALRLHDHLQLLEAARAAFDGSSAIHRAPEAARRYFVGRERPLVSQDRCSFLRKPR
mmetsp:Transcript_65298/g.183873  ORF Transcript_65298/g.183873 Transcript_65298/m.183873 type:complete len:198 (-) Transcript_65298:323-916(-)